MYFSTGSGQTMEANKAGAAIAVVGLIFCIYCEIGEYKMKEEYTVFTEQGIEYTYSEKMKLILYYGKIFRR